MERTAGQPYILGAGLISVTTTKISRWLTRRGPQPTVFYNIIVVRVGILVVTPGNREGSVTERGSPRERVRHIKRHYSLGPTNTATLEYSNGWAYLGRNVSPLTWFEQRPRH